MTIIVIPLGIVHHLLYILGGLMTIVVIPLGIVRTRRPDDHRCDPLAMDLFARLEDDK